MQKKSVFNMAVGIALIIVMLALSACSGNKTEAPNEPSPTPTASASAAAATPEAEPEPAVDLSQAMEISFVEEGDIPGADNRLNAFIEQKFNVKFNWVSVPWQEFANTLNLQVASGELADLTAFTLPATYSTYQALQSDGRLLNISAMVEKYQFANIAKYLAEKPNMEVFKEKDGNFYTIPVRYGPTTSALIVRKDWLDKLGLKKPGTYEEYRSMLQSFVDNNPDGAGTGTSGLGFKGMNDVNFILTGYTGTVDMWTKRDGEWTSRVFLPEFKEAIRYVHGLYEDGLLDPEFAITNRANMLAKFYQGKIGSFVINGLQDIINEVQGGLKAIQPDGEITILTTLPAGPAGPIKGDTSVGYLHELVIPSSVSEEKAVRILAIIDYLLSEEGDRFLEFGLENVHYTLSDGKPVVNEEEKAKDFFGGIHHPFIHMGASFDIPKRAFTGEVLANYEDALVNSVTTQLFGLTSELTMQLDPQINEIYNKWLVNLIAGSADIDKDWDKFLGEFKNAGAEQYIAELKRLKP